MESIDITVQQIPFLFKVDPIWHGIKKRIWQGGKEKGKRGKGKTGNRGRKERKERESYIKNIIIHWSNTDLTVEPFENTIWHKTDAHLRDLFGIIGVTEVEVLEPPPKFMFKTRKQTIKRTHNSWREIYLCMFIQI